MENNYIYYKMQDEITYPFPKFNGGALEVREWMNNYIPYFTEFVITYLCRD